MKKNLSSIFMLALVAMLGIFASCNKLSKQTVFNNNNNQPPITPDSVILKPGVIVIDSTQWLLASSAAQIGQGEYTYFGNNLPAFIVNDIIIGITGEGYLRKVTSVVSQSGQVTLSTIPAKLEDVFQQANINFTTDASNLMRKTGGGYTYNISNTSLLQDGVASISLTSGSISINPNWNFNMQFQNGSLTGFSAICQNGTMNANVQMNVASTGAENVNATTTLNPVSGRTIVWIGQLPIVVTTYLSFAASATGNVTAAANGTPSFTTSDNYTVGDVFNSGSWQGSYSFSHTAAMTGGLPSVAGFSLACSIAPQMTLKIYGVACPSTSFSLTTFENVVDGFTEQQSISTSGSILGYGVPDDSRSWTTDTTYFVAMSNSYKLLKTSGDGQHGAAYEYLGAPLVVQVTDNSGVAQAGVSVTFSVTSGDGLLSHYTTTTNAGGYAQTNWQLGNPAAKAQIVQVVAHTAAGAVISGSPLTFTAL